MVLINSDWSSMLACKLGSPLLFCFCFPRCVIPCSRVCCCFSRFAVPPLHFGWLAENVSQGRFFFNFFSRFIRRSRAWYFSRFAVPPLHVVVFLDPGSFIQRPRSVYEICLHIHICRRRTICFSALGGSGKTLHTIYMTSRILEGGDARSGIYLM